MTDPTDDLPDPSPGDVPESVLPADQLEHGEHPAMTFLRKHPAAAVLAEVMSMGWQSYFLGRQNLIDLCRELQMKDEDSSVIIELLGKAMHKQAESNSVTVVAVIEALEQRVLPYLKARTQAEDQAAIETEASA